MSYFPTSVMPKQLMKETLYEVDGSPLIYNAKDYNTHHREIRQIQQLLLGNTDSAQTAADASDETKASSISDVVKRLKDTMTKIANGGLMMQYSGIIPSGKTIPIPSGVTSTSTSGAITAGATTISVSSTSGFPSSGYITKFNSNPVVEYCVGGGYPGGGGACGIGQYKYLEYEKFIGGSAQRTFQEIISYSGKTDTSFLNCVRGVNGSTAEDLSSGTAVIICGQASLFLTPNTWTCNTTKPIYNQMYITNDADLTVNAAILEQGSRTIVKAELQDMIDVMYSLTVIGGFDVPDVAQTYSVGGA